MDRAYALGDRGLWVKSKCLNREEFVVIGWTDPAGSRSHIGALWLGYYTEDGKLQYAGREKGEREPSGEMCRAGDHARHDLHPM